MTHGWPGSMFELLKTAGRLTDPMAYGGRAEDAFDLVLPSMPGYGFSGKPTRTGWDADRIARAWAELMKRLGYARYVAQGGDWGSPVTGAMARQAPAGLLGIHINFPATVPPEIVKALAGDGSVPAGLSDKERATFDALGASAKKGDRSYAMMMGTKPQTIGYGLDGLSGWPRSVDARASGLRAVDVQQQTIPKKSRGRGPGRDHAVLADEQRNLGRAALLGTRRTKRYFFGHAEDRRDLAPGRHHGVSRGDLSSPGDMGPSRLSQAHLLPRGRQGRALRGLGTAANLL